MKYQLLLHQPVPPPPPTIISDLTGQTLPGITDPVREGSTLTLICESVGGDPLPRLTWWRNQAILDDVVEVVDARGLRVRNRLRLNGLRRQDHGTELTCRATNTNLTSYSETNVEVNMVCKYFI